MSIAAKIRTTFWVGVIAVTAVTAMSMFSDDGPDEGPSKDNRPEFGPDKPGYDKDRGCWRLSFEIEGVATRSRNPGRVDSFRVNYEATLGSAGVAGGSNVKIWDGLVHRSGPVWKKNFCARPGDWLHGDVTLAPGQVPVASMSCYFGMGPQEPEDQEIDTHIGDDSEQNFDKLTTHAWCEAVVPPAP